ncbi:MAG: phosphotransferase [Elusimicrobiaceae bacterium]|nr:phosphotransferase [Elusimicrobiaceae bacterium]
MQIIVQAGGRGTRLEYLTHNRPKCLVPVRNKPLIFHLFDKYPKAQFVIIGDYKYEVLERYLATFAKHVHYKLLHAQGTGNICGIKEALEYVPAQEKLMLIWSDLLLADDFKPETLPSGNYVGILPGSPCSWRFQNGVLEKVASDTCGVAGCFIFENKQVLQNIVPNGSFTLWLKNSGIKLQPLPLSQCLEVGTLEALQKIEKELPRCRPYNRMKFSEDTVVKEGLTEEGRKLIDREIDWYRKMAQYGFKEVPEIYRYHPLTMRRIDGSNIFQAKLTRSQQELVTDLLIAGVNKLHSYETQPANPEDLTQEYYTKTMQRLQSIASALPFSQDPYIEINGKKCKNPLVFKADFKAAVQAKLLDTIFCPIHGDCTLTNALLDNSLAIYFIDPRGYFGKQKVLGDIRYDWAKLYYSMAGNFDRFNIKDFRLSITGKAVVFHIASNGWEAQAQRVLDNMKHCQEKEIRFIHAIIWLSLASHCWEDYDSMCLAFYNGVYLVQEFLEGQTTGYHLRLSELGHTWVLDLDGTLVRHNGYKTGEDEFLPGAKEFLESIPPQDYVLILTAREKEARPKTEAFLQKHHIRYNEIFFEMPMGERILINDNKPSGLQCAYSLAPERNQGLENVTVTIDKEL